MSLPKLPFFVLAALGLSGCDLPTELPRWTTEWEVLAVDRTLGMADLLPRGVRQVPGGFAFDSFSVASSLRLADACPLCTCYDGPIPGLDIAHDWPIQLPPNVYEAEVSSGKARLVLVNEIGFDPLDDGSGGKGTLEVALTDRYTGQVFDRRLVSGSLPVGDSLRIELDLTGLRAHSGLVARVSGHTAGSGGCPVRFTDRSGFAARMDMVGVVSRTVDVYLPDASLALPPRSVTLPGWLARRLRPSDARLALDIEVHSGMPLTAEVGLSVATAAQTLFTPDAALETPLMLRAPTGAAASDAHGLFLLDLAGIPDADELHFAARPRIIGSSIARLRGTETLRYELRLRAEVPSE